MCLFLKRITERFRKKKQRGPDRRAALLNRTFDLKSDFALTIQEVAKKQQREEAQVFNDVIKAGINQILRDDNEYGEIWDSLSRIEQEITALLCLDYSSYEIAKVLSISYDTVRYHSKNIYKKYGLQRKELRQALKGWNFAEWWGTRHS